MNLSDTHCSKKRKIIFIIGCALLGLLIVYSIMNLPGEAKLKSFSNTLEYYNYVKGGDVTFQELKILRAFLSTIVLVFTVSSSILVIRLIQRRNQRRENTNEIKSETQKSLTGPIAFCAISGAVLTLCAVFYVTILFSPFSPSFNGLGEKGSKNMETLTDSDLSSLEASDSSLDAVSGKASSTSHSETYVQVEGIDEADIVKTDGKYIYFIPRADKSIHIVEVDKDKIKEKSILLWHNFDMTPNTLYLDGDNLIVVGEVDGVSDFNYKDTRKNKEFFGTLTMVSVFNIKDRSNPVETYSFAQFGTYNTSRYVDGKIYLLSDYFPTYKDKMIRPAYGDNGKAQNLPMKDVYYLEHNESMDSFLTMSAIDITNLKHDSSKAIMGNINDIYMNNEHLYLASDAIEDYTKWVTVEDNTNIIKINLNNGQLSPGGFVTIPGQINNQYSMDEYNNYFRVATTTTSGSWIKGNRLFIINDKMDVIGNIDKLAYNEDIKAVRYMGDIAYVITFRNTDPLFVLDLSDPSNPKVKGEVKITGFSSMLEPIGNDKMLGIGYAADDSSDQGLKLSLFDVSDMTNPKVLDSIEKPSTYSDVQVDPHALLKNKDKHYYGLTYYVKNRDSDLVDYNMEAGVSQSNMYLFNIKDNKINVFRDDKLKHLSSRILYIDDWIYAVGDNGKIQVIHLK